MVPRINRCIGVIAARTAVTPEMVRSALMRVMDPEYGTLSIVDLGIVDDVAVDDDEEVEGEVEFIAKLIFNNKLEVLHEVSQFEKIDGRWLYHSGEFKDVKDNSQKIKGSAPCPCGSGKLFKNCHAK